MAKVLFATFGSYGDVYPYLAIARELKVRGHTASIATSETHRTRIEGLGIGFHSARPDVTATDPERMREFFHPKRGSENVIRFVSSFVRESFEDMEPAVKTADIVVTQIMALAAVAAAQKHRKPWASTVLAPASLLSAFDPPLLPPAPWLMHLRWMGPGVMRRLFAVGKAQSLVWVDPVVQLRKSLGLATEQHPFFEGANSPDRILALFSKAFLPRPADWPRQTVVTGFPFLDESAPLEPRIADFLHDGQEPIAFTLGSSAVNLADDFYRVSAEAALRLGRRALLLTGAAAQDLPDGLPGTIAVAEYAPHEQVFPYAAAVVHQGGIGTTAQALRAGRPELVVPFAHDQPDNALRVARIGAGRSLPRLRYTLPQATAALRELLQQPTFAQRARRIATLIAQENGAKTAADEIEKLAGIEISP